MNRIRSWASAGAVSLASCFLLAGAASATTLTWDTNTGSAGAQGGSGTWTNQGATAINWLIGAVNRPWSNAAPDAAIFGGTGGTIGTVSLAVAISATGLTFQSDYLIRSNRLTLFTPGLITVDGGLSTISSTLAGAILAKAGAGTLAITANATNTGTATVSAGVLRLTNSGSLFNNGGAGTLTIAPGGTLSLSRSDAFGIHSSAPALTVNIDTNGLVENAATFNTLGTLAFRGGELRANGGANTNFEAYQLKGPVTVGAEVMSRITGPGGLNGFTGVQVGNNTAGGQTTFTVADGAAAVDFSVETALIDGKNAGQTAFVPSGFIKGGPGRMELSANNRFSGTASVNGGVLALGAAGTISNGAVDVGAGSVFDVTAVSGFTMPAGMTIQGDGVVSGSVVTADGARILPGSATGAGTLTIAGDLLLSGTSGYTNTFDLTNSFASGANDRLNVTGFLDPVGNPFRINARARLASGTYDLIQYGTLNPAATFGPVLGNTYRGDTWTLNTNTTGWIKLDVTAGAAADLRWLPGTENGDWNLATSNWVDQSTSTITDRFYDLDSVVFDELGAYSNTVILTAAVRPTAVVVDGSSNYVFTGTGRIGDAPGTLTKLTKSGSGSLTIETDHDFTGGTVVSNGVLQVGIGGGAGSVGTGPVQIAAPGTVLLVRSNAGFNVANALTGNGTFMIGGSTIATGESWYNFSGVNTGFVGTMVVSNGARFNADNANDVGNAALIQIKDGGGLYHSAGTFGRPIEIAGIGWLEGSGRLGAMRIENATWTGAVTLTANARIGAANGNGTVSGPISGPYELEIWAGGTARSITLTPPTPNTYASLRVSSNGIVVANNTNAYSQGPVIMNGGTQRLNGFSFAFSNLTSTAAGGNIQNGSATLPATFTVGLDDSSTAYGGVFANGAAGVLNVTKVGAGTLTLDGASVNSGAFTIQNGTLALSAAGTIASLSTVVLAGGSFNTSSKGPYTPTHVVRGSGTLVGSQFYTGGTVVLPGSAGAAGTISVTGNLSMNSTYTNRFDLSTDPLAVGGGTNDLITVTGGLEPGNSRIAVSYAAPLANGSYTLFTYTGSKLGSFSAVTGNGTRAIWTLVETNPGTVNLEVAGSGSYLGLKWNPQVSSNWDINVGANWLDTVGFTNTVFFDGDTVLFDDSGAVTSAVNLVGTLVPASVTVNAANNYSLTGPGRISGLTGLTKDGAGTLTLGGATHDFGGSVTISGGVLKVAPANVLPASAPVSVASGATLNLDAANASYTSLNPIGGAGTILVTFNGGTANNLYLQGVSTGFTGLLELTAVGTVGSKLNSSGLNIDPTAIIKVNSGAQFFMAGTSLANPLQIAGIGNNENRGAIRLGSTNTLMGPVTLLTNASIFLEGGNISGDITNGVATPSVLTLGTSAGAGVGRFSGTIADGAGVLALVVTNSTPTLSGTNTYTGGTVLRTGGQLVVNTISDTGVSSIGNTGDLTFNGGGLRYTGTDLVGTARTITNTGAATIDISNAPATLVVSGPFGGPGQFTKAGLGTMVLSNVNYVTSSSYVANRGTLMFDGGSYTSTAAGTGDLIGNAGGQSATVILSNNVQYAKTEVIWGGYAANATGTVWMHSGNVRSGSIRMGNNAAASGAFYQLGGSSYASGEIDAGYNAATYGFILLAGGAMSNSSWQQAARTGVGLFYLLGGSDSILTSGNGFVAANNNGTGVFYFAGSTITNAGRLGIGWTGTSRGEVNIMAGNVLPATNVGVQFNQQAGGSAIGILNLNGGTLQTPTIFKQNAGGYSVVNLDGGTIQSTASQPLLGLTGGTTSAVDAVYVRAGGAALDSSNYAVTVAQPLLAPTGNGVTALPAVPANAGFIGAPYVEIRGGGGNGATAVALFDLASGSVTGLVLTSPGVGYAAAPTVTLVGGGPVNNTALGVATIGTQNSGGLTKLGSGSLFLNSANTYTGRTTVSDGALGGTGSLAGEVVVSGTATLGPAPSFAPTGTLTIAGSVTLTNGSTLSAFMNGATPTLAIAGDLNTWAVNPVQIVRAGPVSPGTHVLVDYAGAFGGDTNNLQLVSVPNGGQGYLQVNTIDSTVELVVTNAGLGVKWDGSVNASWEHGGPANWKSLTTDLLTPYSPYDEVLFDDTATGTYDVNLTDPVQPGSLIVDNATSNYTFGGTGLVGPASLVKNGAAQLTLAGTQGHTGGTLLNTGTIRLASAAAAGGVGASLTFNGGALVYGLDAPGNAYAGLLANNTTVVLDRATGGAGITNTLGNLTVSGDFAIDVAAGPNVTSGEAWLTQSGTFAASTRVLTFNIGPSVVYNQTGAFLGGVAQNVGVIKNGAGRLILAGNSDTWDNPSPAIQLNAGALELRRVPGDAGDNRAIDAASNTTLTLNQAAGTHFFSTLNVKDSMTVVSERTTVGDGLTHVLRLLNFLGTNATLTVMAGGNVTNGTAAVTFNTTTLGTGTTINVVNPVDTNVVTLASITGIVSGVDLSLTKTGSGTLTLRGPGAMTYSGGTIVNEGVLNLSYSQNSANIGTIKGPLTIGPGATVFSTVQKALGLVGAPSGNVTVITINGGLLEHTTIGGMNGGQTVYMTAAEIRSNGGIPSDSSGCFRIGGGPDPTVYVLASSATSLFSGRIALDTTGRFDVQDGAAEADLLIAASITDGIATGNPPFGFIKTNSGTMVLASPSTYKGVTSVDGGRLLVNNGTGLGTGTNALLVGAAGTLGGTGLVGGTVTSDGIVAPGASAGQLTIGGDYLQNASGSLVIELGGTSAGVNHDLLVVSNSVGLSGGLSVSLINGFVPATNDIFLIVDGTSLGGTFGSLSMPALASGLGWDVQYLGSGEVVLTITGGVALTGYDLAATVITNGLTGYQDDADGDGYANLLEYVTGGSLTNPGTQARMNGGRTNNVLALKFFRDTNAVDATIFVEGSYTATNGADWVGVATNLAGSWGGSPTNVTESVGSPASVTVQDTISTATNRFLRLRVTRP